MSGLAKAVALTAAASSLLAGACASGTSVPGSSSGATSAPTARVVLPVGLSTSIGGMAVTSQGSALVALGAVGPPPRPMLRSSGHPATLVKVRRNGTLDPTFGSDGVVTLSIAMRPYSAVTPGTVAVDGAGRIWVLGIALGPSVPPEGAVERLLPNGSPDPTFGTNGVSSFLFLSAEFGGPYDATFDGSGGIFVAGSSAVDSLGVPGNVEHLSSDGTVDSGFGDDEPLLDTTRGAMTLVAGGNIVVVGNDEPGQPTKIEVYDHSGQPLGNPLVPLPLIPNPPGAVSSVVEQPGGKLLVATDQAVGRYLPNGILDPSWEAGCAQLISLDDPVIVADGGIATASVSDGHAVLVVRDAEGGVDDRVGAGGVVKTNTVATASTELVVASAPGFVDLLTTTPGGPTGADVTLTTVALPATGVPAGPQVAACHPSPTTTAGPTSGNNETTTSTVALPAGVLAGIGGAAITTDGSVIVALTSGVPGSRLEKVRPDGMLDPTFGSDGVTPLSIVVGIGDGGLGTAARTLPGTVAVDTLGRIWVLGIAPGGTRQPPVAAVERLTPDGSPDPTFGTHGVASFPLPLGFVGQSGLYDATFDGAGGIYVANTLALGDEAVNAASGTLTHIRADGTVDSTFGRGGTLDTAAGAVTRLADGNIAVIGEPTFGQPDDYKTVVAAYDSAGNQVGQPVLLTPDPDAYGAFSAEDQSGTVLVTTDKSAARYLPNGTLDPAWNQGCGLLPLTSQTHPVILADGGIATTAITAGQATLVVRDAAGNLDGRVGPNGLLHTAAPASTSTELVVTSGHGFVDILTSDFPAVTADTITVSRFPLPATGGPAAAPAGSQGSTCPSR
jgi:uncharacterized delta-60 repeat protein